MVGKSRVGDLTGDNGGEGVFVKGTSGTESLTFFLGGEEEVGEGKFHFYFANFARNSLF